MNPVRGKAEEDGQVANRPNKVSEASLHKASRNCWRWFCQQGRHDAASVACVKSKMARLPLRKTLRPRQNRPSLPCRAAMLLLAVLSSYVNTTLAQEQPGAGEGYEREELGVNRYTAPSIEGVFEQLDK